MGFNFVGGNALHKAVILISLFDIELPGIMVESIRNAARLSLAIVVVVPLPDAFRGAF